MATDLYCVYYNAVMTKHGAHLMALGWTYQIGVQGRLQKETGTNNFRFGLEALGPRATTEEPVPLLVTALIPNPPKSIHVTDDYGTQQVQVNGIEETTSGKNKPGAWIKSGKLD